MYCGCTTPASDGGTPAAAIAGPTSGPTGTVPIGGGVGGGKVGVVTASPIEPTPPPGGNADVGMIGTKSGKNGTVGPGVKVSAIAVSVVAALVM